MFSIKSNIDEFQKDLDRAAKTQIPYATSLALNILARAVIAGEVEEIEKDFPTATPFTKRGFGYIPATKSNPFTTVFVKDAQETYLEPYTDGGQSVPTKGGAMVVPVKIPVNAYGNIPYRKIQTLLGKVAGKKGKPSVFYTSKSDPRFHGARAYSGVFERVQYGVGKRGGALTHLVTLARIADPWTVKQHFAFEQRAIETVERNVQDAMEQALLRALDGMR